MRVYSLSHPVCAHSDAHCSSSLHLRMHLLRIVHHVIYIFSLFSLAPLLCLQFILADRIFHFRGKETRSSRVRGKPRCTAKCTALIAFLPTVSLVLEKKKKKKNKYFQAVLHFTSFLDSFYTLPSPFSFFSFRTMLQRAFQNLAALETNLDETNFVAVKLRKKKKRKKAQSSDLGIFHEREFDLCTRSLDPHEGGAFNHEPSFNRPEMKSFARPSFVENVSTPIEPAQPDGENKILFVELPKLTFPNNTTHIHCP